MYKIITVFLVLLALSASAEDQTYFEEILAENVLILISGDTITLAGVLPHPFSNAAAHKSDYLSGSEYLESILKGKLFRVVDTKEQTLPYRSVIISIGDSLQMNLKMVADGYALADLAVSYQFSEDFLHAELLARRQQLGIWALAGSTPLPVEEQSKKVEYVAERPHINLSELKPEDETREERVARLKRDLTTLGKTSKELERPIVYVRLDETKYHRSNCPRLDDKGISIAKDEAKKYKFSACSRCRPLGE